MKIGRNYQEQLSVACYRQRAHECRLEVNRRKQVITLKTPASGSISAMGILRKLTKPRDDNEPALGRNLPHCAKAVFSPTPETMHPGI
jgi:ADP-ribose pyrophosphatase YjhB (NUDIX family)